VEAEPEEGGRADRDHRPAVGGEARDRGLGQLERRGDGGERLRIEAGDRGGCPAARSVAVLRHELAAVEDDERVVRAIDGEPVRGEDVELGAEPVRPATEDEVEVAARMGGDPTRPERPAGKRRRSRRYRERLRVEPL